MSALKYHTMDENNKHDLMAISDYSSLVEELRIRLDIINTSVFLLEDNSTKNNPKQNKYLNKIKAEMDKIRILITSHPKDQNFNQSV